MTPTLSRRGFLASAGALVVALSLPTSAQAHGSELPGELNAFVVIEPDGTTLVQIPSCEMGQGVTTAFPQIVMEELDGDFDKLRVVTAVGDAYRIHLPMGIKQQFTGGSLSIQTWAQSFQEAGASARAQLIAAAAARWGVSAADCSTESGVVHGPDGQQAGYGELATEAAAIHASKAPLRNPRTFIGKSIPRTDIPDKVTGVAQFGIDIRRPGMVRASLAACPVFGGRVGTVDDSAARALPGVSDVLVFDDFVAVIADTWWPAQKGVEALKIDWDTSAKGVDPSLDDAGVSAALHAALDAKTKKIYGHGSPKELGDSPLEATYEVPYLEHNTLEPLNCTVEITADGCDIWTGTQAQTLTMRAAKSITGLPESQIRIHTTLLGGGFGRRGNVDFIEQALQIGMRMPGTPVHLQWSRAECVQHGWYRPAAVGRMRGVVRDGIPHAIEATVARDNVLHRYLPRLLWGLKPVLETSLEGLIHEMPYGFETWRVEYAFCDLPVPIGFWRSVAHSHNAFFLESFLDELAHSEGIDPVAFRLSVLGDSPRHRAVLETAVKQSGWGEAPDGHSQGVALHASFGSICAHVAEVSVDDGQLVVHRITTAIDCGRAINPDIVKAQMMGGAMFALSELRYGGIHLDQGRVSQSNFHDLPLLRMHESCDVDVHIVDSGAELGGIGEVAVPPLAPAVCNAIFAATGQRIRKLPLPAKLEVSS